MCYAGDGVPLKWIRYVVDGDLILILGSSMFYLLKGDYKPRYIPFYTIVVSIFFSIIPI